MNALLAQWEIVAVAEPQKATVGERTAYMTVVERVALGAQPVYESVDVVLLATGDVELTGEWEVTMGDELFFEEVTFPGEPVPTAGDVESFLLCRDAYDRAEGRSLDGLPRRWVHRRYAGHGEGEYLMTSVREGRLHEVLVSRS